MRSCGFKSHLPHAEWYELCKINSYGLRKCRNWQTSKIQVLVSVTLVRVQVPSSALNGAKPNPVYFFKKVFAVVVNFTRK